MEEITYALDFRARGPGHGENKMLSGDGRRANGEEAACAVPRIARLLALAIRFDRLLRAEQFRDYAELARLGRVSRARMTQIMKLLDLAPDIQEQILFLPNLKVSTRETCGQLSAGSTGTSSGACFRRSSPSRAVARRSRPPIRVADVVQ